VSVHYEQINNMFLKEHRRVPELEATVTQQQDNFDSGLAEQQKQIGALNMGLQKVSAELELTKSAPQTVQNDR
jgi:hypothetical protein